MFSQLILQFSVFHLCFSLEKGSKKEKEKEKKSGFPVSKLAAMPVPVHTN
jgi:hypothetical protein